jgi:hypothetical protein
VGALLGSARHHPPDRPGALQRLNLGLLIHAQHHRPLGWLQVQPDHVVDLGDQVGVVRERGETTDRQPGTRVLPCEAGLPVPVAADRA